MITLGKRGDLQRRSTSLACCRLCDRLLNLQRLRLLKRFCSLGIWRLRFRVRPAPARQPLRLRRCGRWPGAVIEIRGPVAGEFYKDFAKHRGTWIKADGESIVSVKMFSPAEQAKVG